MAKRILVSGYFGGRGHERKIDYLERLNQALAAHDTQIMLYDLSPDRLTTRLDTLTAPYAVTLARRLPWAADLPAGESELRRSAEVEAAIWNCAPARAAAHVKQFAFHFIGALRRTMPNLVVLWHQFNGLHYLAREICDTMRIPFVFAEYGELPGTIALSADGQMGMSLPARDPVAFAQRPVEDSMMAAVTRYIERMAAERRTRKSQENSEATRTDLTRLKDRARPVVLYAGQNDPAAGLIPRWHSDSRAHSPFFNDTLDALGHLARLADERDWSLVFKPHPLQAGRHAAEAAARFPAVTVIERGDIFECIEAAAAVVTVVSQVAYLALIRARPALVLGRIALSGSGAIYEVKSRDDVGNELQTAIERGMTSAHQSARDRHFAQLLDYSLFTIDSDLESILGRTPDAAAEFLVKHRWTDVPDFRARIPFAPAGVAAAGVCTRFVTGELVRPWRALFKSIEL